MRLNEIEWANGSKYILSFFSEEFVENTISYNIIVRQGELLMADFGNQSLFEEYIAKHIVQNGNFEKVIEPVDFITAYQDCKLNGGEYKGLEFESDRIWRSGASNVFLYKAQQTTGKIQCNQMWEKVNSET